MEIWQPVDGWEDLYEISNMGRIRQFGGRLLRPFHAGAGYLQIRLCVDGYRQRPYIHQLVAEAFLGPGPEGHEVNHINFDKADNRAVNLEWVPHVRNQGHAAAHDRMRKPKQRKLTVEQVQWVRTNRSGSAHKMADQLGVTSIVIYQIWNGLTYRDIP